MELHINVDIINFKLKKQVRELSCRRVVLKSLNFAEAGNRLKAGTDQPNLRKYGLTRSKNINVKDDIFRRGGYCPHMYGGPFTALSWCGKPQKPMYHVTNRMAERFKIVGKIFGSLYDMVLYNLY